MQGHVKLLYSPRFARWRLLHSLWGVSGLNQGKMVLLWSNLRPREPWGLWPLVPRSVVKSLIILHFIPLIARPGGVKLLHTLAMRAIKLLHCSACCFAASEAASRSQIGIKCTISQQLRQYLPGHLVTSGAITTA